MIGAIADDKPGTGAWVSSEEDFLLADGLGDQFQGLGFAQRIVVGFASIHVDPNGLSIQYPRPHCDCGASREVADRRIRFQHEPAPQPLSAFLLISQT